MYIYRHIDNMKLGHKNLQSLTRANRDELTASDNSIGSSGGTTDVRIRVHSRNSLYLFLLGSLVPIKTQ